jgi:molybdopterin-biosynthesis enzyme MoeA-like protein
MSSVKQFGVVIIGDETLCGKRTDKHLPHVIEDLQARGMQVAWSRVMGDHRQRLVHELKTTQLDALPVDCLLISNPHNRIPGFTLYDHHFFPGFPSMAWPMLDWVLDHYYPHDAAREMEKSVRVSHASESDLVQLMDELSAGLSGAKLFSLPHMGSIPSIELGFRGEQSAVEAAFSGLVAVLSTRGLKFEGLQEVEETCALRQTVV